MIAFALASERMRFLVAAGAALSGFLLVSAANLDHVPATVPLGLGLLLALSVWRPPAALVITAVLLPLSWWITRTADLLPLRLAEAIVLAVLSGSCLRLAWSRLREAAEPPALPAGVGPAAVTVLAVAAASAIVDLAPAQAGLYGTWLLVTDTVSQIASDYLYGTIAVAPGLADAARLGEGVALLLIVVVWSRRQANLPRRLAVASLAGGAGAALVNLSVGADAILATDQPATMLLRELAGGRITLHSSMANLGVTGEYFLMATWVGIGLVAGPRRLWLYGVATLATGVTVWIIGSRTLLGVAALTTLGAATVWMLRRRPAARHRRVLIAGVLVAVVLLPMAIVTVYSQRAGVFDTAVNSDDDLAALTRLLYTETTQHVRLRVEFAAAGLRMWATEPVFGVGAGRYHGLSVRFMSPWLRGFYPHGENAHNNYLQIAAELGIVGLAAFLCLLAALGWNIWHAARARPRLDPLLVGSAAGTASFLAASLTGHPLLLGETAYPFWIVAGVAMAIAELQHPSALDGAGRHRTIGWMLAPVLFLLATLPVRVEHFAETLLRTNARDGLDGLRGTFAVEMERAEGTRFRWTGPRGTFFVPRGAALVQFPLRAQHAGRDRPVAVAVAIDGRQVMRVPLPGPVWIDVSVPLGGSSSTSLFHRVDLRIDPPWPPGDRRSGDPRTLGVQLRAVSVVR